ncbi:MAG: DUF4249 domain-containing protein [Bacteroidota bacterium]
MKRIYCLLIVSFLFACEEVIDIDLNDADSKLVIEGFIDNSNGPFTVNISETINYFGETGVVPINVESVMISSAAGDNEELIQVGEGEYRTTNISGKPNETYTLTVMHNNIEITSTSTMPSPIEINKLHYVFDDREFNPAGESGFEVTCFFNDPVGEDNYYRLLIYQNGEILDDSGFYLFDDRFSDGNEISYTFFDRRFDLDDTIKVQLRTLDEQTYEYYDQLNDLLGGGMGPGAGSAAPGNPNTVYNIDVLGVFAAYATNTVNFTIIIE